MSELERTYKALFRQEPSPEVAGLIRTIETEFDVRYDDPFARLIVLQLYLGHWGATAVRKEVGAFRALLDRLEAGRHSWDQLVATITARVQARRWLPRVRFDERPDEPRVWVVGTATPVLTYLRQAFLPRTGHLQDEHIVAARWSTFFLSAGMLLAGLMGVFIGRVTG